MIDHVGREAQRVVETYDKQREAEAIAEQARAAVTAAAAAGGAALGLGTLVTLAASTAAADVTGILLASVVAALGFLIIPARRRKAKAAMQQKITALRERLSAALRMEFERAGDESRGRIEQAIAPYSRFVRAEHARWSEARGTLARLRDRAGIVPGTPRCIKKASGTVARIDALPTAVIASLSVFLLHRAADPLPRVRPEG